MPVPVSHGKSQQQAVCLAASREAAGPLSPVSSATDLESAQNVPVGKKKTRSPRLSGHLFGPQQKLLSPWFSFQCRNPGKVVLRVGAH